VILNLPPMSILKVRQQAGWMYRYVEKDVFLPFALIHHQFLWDTDMT